MRKMENRDPLVLHSKSDFQHFFESFLFPLKDRYSEGGARLVLGTSGASYDRTAAELEGFSRVLWGLAAYLAGGKSDPFFEEIVIEGLEHGTDPAHPEYWGGFRDRDQRFVEMAAIGFAITVCPGKFWDPLTEEGKDRLARWLYAINEYALPDTNWLYFGLMANLGLKAAGRPYSEEKICFFFDRVESFYLGNGWYRDGASGQKDYYISWTIQIYQLFYAKYFGEEDPARAACFRERALEFGRSFIYWFDENGAAVPYGRSLTYRFAEVSFFSWCLIADVYPFPVPVIKGIIARHFRYWDALPIRDAGGILSIGYGYPDLIVSDPYNSPGSPYWAFEAFAFLMLPDGHPFFEAVEAPYPADLPETLFIPEAEMLVRRYPGHSVILPSGAHAGKAPAGQTAAKYARFVYDSAFPFSCTRSIFTAEECAPESTLFFRIPDAAAGELIRFRTGVESFTVSENGVKSAWSPAEGIRVETEIRLTENGHIRRHTVTAAFPVEACDTAFAADTDDDARPVFITEEGSSELKNVHGSVRICSLPGAIPGSGTIIRAAANTNLLYPRTAIPGISFRLPAGTTVIETRIETEVYGK